MEPSRLFKDTEPIDNNLKGIGNRLYIKFHPGNDDKVILYRNDMPIKPVDLSDKVAKRLLVVEAVEMGATGTLLAKVLRISRQTIHNYLETKKRFGLEGLIAGYAPERGKNLQKWRREHASRLPTGNKARELERIRKRERESLAHHARELPFGNQSVKVSPEELPFSGEHDWEPTRYAGVIPYLITLIFQYDWFKFILQTSLFCIKNRLIFWTQLTICSVIKNCF